MIARGQGKVHVPQSPQCHLAQAAADRISDDQRADENRTSDRGAEQRAEMRSGMKAQAAPDEREGGHLTAGVALASNFPSRNSKMRFMRRARSSACVTT